MIPAWALVVGFMLVVTDKIWTWWWVGQIKVCIWIAGLLSEIGSLNVKYGLFSAKRCKDFDWIHEL